MVVKLRISSIRIITSRIGYNIFNFIANNTQMKNLSILLTILIAVFSVDSLTAQKRNIEIEDYFKLKRVGNPRISPDNEWVAYTVGEYDDEKKMKTRIWMIPSKGDESIAMTAKGTSSSRPRWSPDGKYLSFSANRDESKSQVWGLNRKGGEAVQLTYVKQGIQSYEWSPDGSLLLLSIKDMNPKDSVEKKEDKKEPVVVDRLQFKRDYVGYLDTLRTHLYTVKPGDSLLTQLTFGPFDDSQPVWSPDGTKIAFVSNRTDNPDGNSNRDIWIVSVDKPGELKQVTANPGSDSSPAWSPDGKSLAYITVVEPDLIWYATSHLAVIPAKGGQAKLLTKEIDRNISSPVFTSSGKEILFNIEDSGERHLGRIGTDGTGFTRLIDGNISLRDFHLGKNGSIASLIRNASSPGEIYTLDNGKNQVLTSVNTEFLETINISQVENIQFKSADGTEIEGFLYRPVGYEISKKYPTLLRIHGGPVSQYDFSFNFDAQLFAANGYAVVMTNPRGSSGYGQDFSKALFADWGNKDFEDVMAGVDYAVDIGVADPEQLGVGGWSYGGILTNYVITKTNKFKGAISGASETNYRALYGHDHYQYQWEKELGLPWKNPELWDKLSPFNYVENVTTPTLWMGGGSDWNVPILGSEQMYQAMKRLGKETQLVVYPGEHHGIRNPDFIADRYERYLDWYQKYVKGEPDQDPQINRELKK